MNEIEVGQVWAHVNPHQSTVTITDICVECNLITGQLEDGSETAILEPETFKRYYHRISPRV